MLYSHIPNKRLWKIVEELLFGLSICSNRNDYCTCSREFSSSALPKVFSSAATNFSATFQPKEMGVLMCSYCHRRYSQEAAVEELYDNSSQVVFFTPTKRRYIGAYTIKYGQKILLL